MKIYEHDYQYETTSNFGTVQPVHRIDQCEKCKADTARIELVLDTPTPQTPKSTEALMQPTERIIVTKPKTEYVSIANVWDREAERLGLAAIDAVRHGAADAAYTLAMLAAHKALYHIPAVTCAEPVNGRHPTARMVAPGDAERERNSKIT